LTILALAARGFLDTIDGWLGIDPDLWADRWPGFDNVLDVVEAATTTTPMLIYAFAAGAALAVRRHPRAGAWTAALMAIAVVLARTLKEIVDRPRPQWDYGVLETLGSPAFPSGHATYAATAAGIAMVLSNVYVRRAELRRIVRFGAIAFALLIGLDRLLLGVHTITDVTAGYLLGAALVLTSLWLFDPAPQPTAPTPFPGSLPTARNLAVVLNPIKVEDVSDFKETVGRLARDAGWNEPVWFETTIEDPGRSMAEDAAVGGANLVLVCGGDGTVRTVCAELAGTGIPVGVVPAGTGNLLARNLDLPLYLNSAIDVALNGQDRAIDIVRVTGDGIEEDEHFLVMAGMGFDAAIMEGVDETIKAKVGWLAYVVSGMKNLMYPPVRVEISIDGGEWTKHRARTVVVGNVGYLQAGMPLMPEASIDDGVLDVVLVYPRRFLSWVLVALRVLSKNRRVDETITRMTGKTVSVRAHHDTPRQIDGDPIGKGRELHCECIHGRLLVRVPR
jgi:YegS/Rv2252/BmrU family lipid kinase